MERIVLNYEPDDTFIKKMIEEGLKTENVGRDEVMKALDDEYSVAKDAKDAIRQCLSECTR